MKLSYFKASFHVAALSSSYESSSPTISSPIVPEFASQTLQSYPAWLEETSFGLFRCTCSGSSTISFLGVPLLTFAPPILDTSTDDVQCTFPLLSDGLLIREAGGCLRFKLSQTGGASRLESKVEGYRSSIVGEGGSWLRRTLYRLTQVVAHKIVMRRWHCFVWRRLNNHR
jgi:hypothetical protein